MAIHNVFIDWLVRIFGFIYKTDLIRIGVPHTGYNVVYIWLQFSESSGNSGAYFERCDDWIIYDTCYTADLQKRSDNKNDNIFILSLSRNFYEAGYERDNLKRYHLGDNSYKSAT